MATAQRIACPVQIFVGSEEFIKWPEMKLVFDTAMEHIPTVFAPGEEERVLPALRQEDQKQQ